MRIPLTTRDRLRRGFAPAAVLLAALATAAQRSDARPADEFLSRDKQLRREGSVWLCPTEVRLRRRFDTLPQVRDRIVKAQEQLGQIVDANQAVWNQRRRLEEAIRALERVRDRAPRGSSPRRQIEQQLEGHREQLVPLLRDAVNPQLLGGIPGVRDAVVSLSNDRTALALALISIRAAAANLDGAYEPYRQDPAVGKALARLGAGHRLGPLRDYQRDLKTLGRYDTLAFSSTTPLYRESGRFRLAVILGERTPVTLTWLDSNEPVILTHNMAVAAGLSVPEDAPRLTFELKERRLTVRRITVPYVRLGKFTFRDIEAYLLPPEGEHVGGQISAGALKGHRVTAEPARLRLTIAPE